MKSKIIYMATIVFLCIFCVTLHYIYDDLQHNRVHQHQEVAKIDDAWNDNEAFVTHLPIISIHTNNQTIPGSPIVNASGETTYELSATGERNIMAEFSVIDNKNNRNCITDTATLTSYANIHYRGNSSRHFDKKSYAIDLVLEDGSNNNQELLGMSKHHKWVLNGPFLDRSLIRNYLCMNVAGEIMEYAPRVKYCELYVDNTYQGVYLLMESIEYGEDRLNLTKTDKNKSYTSFIISQDRLDKSNNFLDNFTKYTLISDTLAFEVRYPGTNNLTESQKSYINDEVSKLEKLLYSSDLYKDNSYMELLDIESFAKYFIINEFFRNIDAGKYSTYYYKDFRGKFKPVVWDFNNSCNNYMDTELDGSGFSLPDAPWFTQLLKDKKFVYLVVELYKELRNTYLSNDYLIQYIEDTDSWLSAATQRNDSLWGYVYDLDNYDEKNYLTPVERNVTSHEEAISQLKSYIIQRGVWLDANISSLYQYCAESKNSNSMIQ